jgi:hypothetical protein
MPKRNERPSQQAKPKTNHAITIHRTDNRQQKFSLAGFPAIAVLNTPAPTPPRLAPISPHPQISGQLPNSSQPMAAFK